MKITYKIILAIWLLSAILGFNALRNGNDSLFYSYIIIAMVVSLTLILVMRICPHCNSNLNKVGPYKCNDYNFFEFYGTDICPHCGVKLYPSESLTAIEERRKMEKSENNQDSK